jgi:hypothetical protein
MGYAHPAMIAISTATDTHSAVPGKPTIPTTHSASSAEPHKIDIGRGCCGGRAEDLWRNGDREDRIEVGDRKGEAEGKKKQLGPKHDETSFKTMEVARKNGSAIVHPSFGAPAPGYDFRQLDLFHLR